MLLLKNDVVKKAEYDKLVTKVNNTDIGTGKFILKSDYDADKLELERKTKISEIENKIPNISNLATKTALTIVENKIPSTNNLVKKTDYNAKITEIENKITNHKHDEYITTPEFNKLASDAFNARIAQANLITKTDFDGKLSGLNRKITKNKSDHLLVKNELFKLNTFDFGHFIGKSHFEEDGVQNYLVFQPVHRYFKFISNTNFISEWISKGLSSESIKPPTTSNNSLAPAINNYGTKTRVKFSGSCLQQSKLTYTHKKIVNIYVVYELGASSSNNNDPTLKNCLFGAVTLTENTDIDKYGYSGYGIEFDRRSSFSFPSGGFGQNIIIFGVNISSSPHIDNKKKDILILGRGPTPELEHALTVEKMYSVNFIVTKKLFRLNLHYNGANSYLFVNGTEIYTFKAKDSEIVASPLCLGNVSKAWSTDNMKRTGFNRYIYDFSVNHDSTDVDDIKDIHKYLTKKNRII